MDKAARIRWTVILLALAGTIAAIVAPTGEADDVVRPSTRSASPVTRAAAAPVPTPGAVAPTMQQPFEMEAEGDPFAPRDWTPPPPPPAPVSAPVAPLVAPVPEAPQAPPLPYKFIGRFSDDAGTYVYLAAGETAHAVRVGDVIAGTHKVVTLQARQMILEHLPTGIKQELPLPDPEQ